MSQLFQLFFTVFFPVGLSKGCAKESVGKRPAGIFFYNINFLLIFLTECVRKPEQMVCWKFFKYTKLISNYFMGETFFSPILTKVHCLMSGENQTLRWISERRELSWVWIFGIKFPWNPSYFNKSNFLEKWGNRKTAKSSNIFANICYKFSGLYPRSWTCYFIAELNVLLTIRQISPILPKNYKVGPKLKLFS